MPLSYCSIACAIQPTVRPTRNSASALPSGSPSAVTAAPSAKSTFGCWPVSCFAADAAAAMRAPEAGRAAAIASMMARARGSPSGYSGWPSPGRSSPRASRAAMTGIGSALSPISSNSASARADWPPCRRPDKAPSAAETTAYGVAPVEATTARDKGRRVQLVIGQQHQNAADQIGARLVQTPGSGELPVHRIAAGFAAGSASAMAATSSARIARPVRMIPARLRSSAARSSAASVASLT